MYKKKFNSQDDRSSFRNYSKSGPERFGSNPSRGRLGGGNRGASSKRSFRGGKDTYIDPTRFINKAVITEEIEHFVPEHSFDDFNIEENLKKIIREKGYIQPTPIQDRAIPYALKGLDVVGIANTGTGKTAAFLLPLINKVLLNKQEQALIVVPMRELAIQIESELRTFTRGPQIFSTCCYGGSPISAQMRKLRQFNHFIIGTPGRLKDLINRKVINLSKISTIVLDEADRMLDMGFVNDMRFVMSMMPKEKQSLFFSATLSSEVERLINEFLREPVRVSVKTRDTSKNIDQDVVRIKSGTNKVDVLHDLLNQPEFKKVLIFGKTKHGVERLSKILNEKGIKTESIHGNKNQRGRERALGLFKENRVQALIATDVAARGLDISDVSHVINYDIPATYQDYIHRIGRTGRADKKGKALTFID